MAVLIFGRVLAGVGAAGIFSSCFQVLIEITTLQERSTYMGLVGACFGLSSVLVRSADSCLVKDDIDGPFFPSSGSPRRRCLHRSRLVEVVLL